MNVKNLVLTLSLAFIFTSGQCFGWGKTGHRIIAEIAQANLNPTAKVNIKKILGDQDLAFVANWADEIKSDARYNHTWTWHYANIADGKNYLDQKRNKDGDVIEAIFRLCDVLGQKKNDASVLGQKQEAIKFLVHLVGDMHQPMHMGLAEDRGGNLLKVTWFKKETNIHAVWDEEIINYEQYSYTEYASHLLKRLKSLTLIEKKNLQVGAGFELDPLQWANDTRQARYGVYKLPTSGDLSYEYVYQSKPIVETQMIKAGMHLASLLNSIFSMKKCPLDQSLSEKIKNNL